MGDAGGGSIVLGCAISLGASLWVLGSFIAVVFLFVPIWALVGPDASALRTITTILELALWIAIGIGGMVWITRRMWKSRAQAIAAGTETTLRAVLVARMAWLIAGVGITVGLAVVVQSPLDPDDPRRTWAFAAAAAVGGLLTVIGYRLSIGRIRRAAAGLDRTQGPRASAARHASPGREIPRSLRGHGPDPDLAAEARRLRDGSSARAHGPDLSTRDKSDGGTPT